LCLNVVFLLSHSIFFPSFPTPLKKMLLASCHGLSGSFSAFLLGESPPYSSRNGENSLPLSSFLQAPVRISVPFTRREVCGLERLIASLPPSLPVSHPSVTHEIWHTFIVITIEYLRMARILFWFCQSVLERGADR